MPYDPEKHHRRSIRLPGADYAAAGGYFITICTYQKRCIFGEVVDGEMHLSPIGQIVNDNWISIGVIHTWMFVDTFVIMPNHVHGILFIQDRDVGATQCVAPTSLPDMRNLSSGPNPSSIGAIIGAFKSATTKEIRSANYLSGGVRVWQRNYYERILRKEDDLHITRYYIETNPGYWERDPNYAPLE